MTVLVALVLAQCVQLDDASPGWNRLDDAPRLAASDDLSQFRADEPVTVVVDELGKLLSGTQRGLGRGTFEFSLPAATQRFVLGFARPLDGAKVDVDAVFARGTLRLLDEKRIGGQEVTVTMPSREPATLRVTVHHHLREAPTLASARAWRQGLPRELGFGPELLHDRALYLFVPKGRTVRVCERTDASWTVRAAELIAPLPVTTVALKRSARVNAAHDAE